MTAGIEADFKELMLDVVLVAQNTGLNTDGEPTYGPVTAYQCAIVHRPREIRTKEGQVLVATAQIYLLTPSGAQPHDQVTLPDSSQPLLAAVERYSDNLTTNYLEVLLTV